MIKPLPKTVSVRLLDVYALMDNVTRGRDHKDVGHQDVDHTYESLRSHLNSYIYLPTDVVQSALWSASMLNEAGEYKHPEDLSYQGLAQKICPPGLTYDEFFHVFKE